MYSKNLIVKFGRQLNIQMKGLLPLVCIFITMTAFIQQDSHRYERVKNDSFKKGEVLEFKMNYGFISIGKGSARIHPNYFKMNDRDCFKVDVYGKTVGVVDWIADVDDHWGAYIDTVALVPHQFYRRIRESNYKKDEWTNFDQQNGKIEVKVLDNKTGKLREPKYYDAPNTIRDMIAGFLYLRTLDLSRTKVGDTLKISGFFEDTFYTMNILYQGKDVVKTKAGKFRAIKLIPIMPDNKVFDGENSVTAWFSDDGNRIPVKISADMFIGSAGVELTGYSGLKKPVNLVK